MDKNLKVKSILVSQPRPETGKSVFDDLAAKYKLKLDFRSFIQVESVPARELRKKKLSVLDHSAVILNSKNAVDNFFRIVEEMRVELPADMKYFCINEGIANYIQKYTVLRKRKVFYGKGGEPEFLNLFLNHKNEKYLFPCSDIRKPSIPDFFAKNKLKITESCMYKTVSADLSDLEDVFYDIIVFFSPADIKSLFENFPHFKQNNTRIAAFGSTTQKALQEAQLLCNIPAPTPETPSIVSAIENYIKKVNG